MFSREEKKKRYEWKATFSNQPKQETEATYHISVCNDQIQLKRSLSPTHQHRLLTYRYNIRTIQTIPYDHSLVGPRGRATCFACANTDFKKSPITNSAMKASTAVVGRARSATMLPPRLSVTQGEELEKEGKY